jgi:DNA-binding XRE family transcriptional regulator
MRMGVEMSKRIKIGSLFHNRRIELGLKQDELADIVGITRTTISNIESERAYPSFELFFSLLAALELDVESLKWLELQDKKMKADLAETIRRRHIAKKLRKERDAINEELRQLNPRTPRSSHDLIDEADL